MFDFTIEDWIGHLTTWYSFDPRLWMLNPSNPYAKVMGTFQAFTNRIVAALRRKDDTSCSLMQDDQLQYIYDGLPCFHTEGEETTFRDWIKKATLKHPQRRTAKQHQWLFIVDLQESMPTGDIVLMVQQAADCLSTWKNSAYAIENLSTDPDDIQYFFRNKHTVKDAERNEADFSESCWICANDFDAAAHYPQQGPCGHIYCRQCFQKALAHMELAHFEAKYTCAFCRSCLVCGASSCKNHVITREKARPVLLDELLGTLHVLCEPEKRRCTGFEPLFGLSPRRYWGLREQSREIRVNLSVQSRILYHDLDPDHELRAKDEINEFVKQLKDLAIDARTLTREDEEKKRRRSAFLGEDPLD